MREVAAKYWNTEAAHGSMFLCSSEPKEYLLQAPVLLRLAFHDAATHEVAAGDGGANASVQYEFSRPENTGLKRGWCGLADDTGPELCSACFIAAPVCRSQILMMHLLESFCVTKNSMCLLLLLVMHGCKSLFGWLVAVSCNYFSTCRRVIENVMQNLEGTAAEGRVSFADLIALGGAYAVLITGGPSIDMSIGELTVCKVQRSVLCSKLPLLQSLMIILQI